MTSRATNAVSCTVATGVATGGDPYWRGVPRRVGACSGVGGAGPKRCGQLQEMRHPELCVLHAALLVVEGAACDSKPIGRCTAASFN